MSKNSDQVRVACTADIHVNEANSREWSALLRDMCDNADIVVLAGDLTNRGLAREGQVLADSLSACRVPIVAVLGNHDYECEEQSEIMRLLCAAGVSVLDEEPCEIGEVGFAGVKGFCGGFDRHALSPFGVGMIKQFVQESVQ